MLQHVGASIILFIYPACDFGKITHWIKFIYSNRGFYMANDDGFYFISQDLNQQQVDKAEYINLSRPNI